jgi:hypothetical protein
MRRVKRSDLIGAIAIWLALCFALTACAKRPPNMTPQMTRVWQATEAAKDLGVAVDAAIALHKTNVCKAPAAGGDPVCQPVLSRADRDVVLDAVDVALALLDKTPENWKVITGEALSQAETKLTAYGKTTFIPYIQAARATLALMQ